MAATICRHRTAPNPQESFQTRQSAPQSAPTGMRCWRRSRPAIQSRGQARIRPDAGRARPLLRLCAYAQTLELVGRGSCMPIDREGAGESDKAAFRVMAMVGVRFQSVRTADQACPGHHAQRARRPFRRCLQHTESTEDAMPHFQHGCSSLLNVGRDHGWVLSLRDDDTVDRKGSRAGDDAGQQTKTQYKPPRA